jgi:hypothetical protein
MNDSKKDIATLDLAGQFGMWASESTPGDSVQRSSEDTFFTA